METKIKIEGMSCQHCVQTIQNELQKVDGVKKVDVILDDKIAIVVHNENLSINKLVEVIEEQGFEANL